MLQVPEADPIEPLQLLVQIKALKEKGFRIGWRLRLSGSELPVVFEHCDFLQVMTREFDGLQLSDIVTKARAATRPGAQALELIASDIATGDDFQLCFRAGFDFFQGPFVTSRENWHPPKSELDRTQVIQILNRLRSGAQSNELANALKRDPVLTYKMLRYVNAPAMGLRKTITEIEQALVILGRDQLYRWLSLLLFDVKSAGFAERALFEQALVRARLMEQIALRCGLPAALAEQLFLTGLFSLLDQMMGQTISQILEKVAVADKVREALLGDQGLFAPFLRLGKACESGQPEEIALLAAACNVDPNTVNQELINALTWANAVGEIGT
jgi:EAL and modified HD-GYP domain-containing signal transduction protein